MVVELSTDEREDVLFDTFNEDGLHIGDVKVDINPITSQRTGTLETYLPQVEDYLAEIREAREQEAAQQIVQTSGQDVQKSERTENEVEVTLTVAECGEFHDLGEFYENIPTVEEAVAIWKQIPPERMNGIPTIGIRIHRPGEESYMDDEIDLPSGGRIDLEILEHIPSIKNEPKVMEVVAELVAKFPDMGNKIEELEEQNYNMIDNVLNNGVEKSQKETARKEQERSAVRTSVKARLGEKKVQIAGQSQNKQENLKNKEREM